MVTRVPGPGKDKLNMLAALAKMEVAVGWFEGNVYEDGTPVAYVAAINEFGYPEGGIPARSFARSTIEEKREEWNKNTVALLKGKTSAEAVMETLGAMAAGDMRVKIASIQNPPLKEGTKAARRSRGNNNTKPLVDTRILLPTLTHQVKK